MYLSRLLLDPRNRQAQRETADPYNLHRTVLRAFGSDRAAASVLHRLEINPRNGQMMLLVQSAIRPDWGWLIEKGYLLPADPFSGLENPAVKEVDLSLQDGQTLQFRLTANPSIKKVRRDEDGKRRNSNRVPLLREDKQLAWIEKRAADNGFRFSYIENEDGELVPHLNISDQKRQTSRKKRITIYTVQFNGRLQITNAALFKEALHKGIGPAKAFGCGLLSLAPA